MSKLTIADIAARAGVSKTSVSRVLNRRPEGVGHETRERIQRVLDETGFEPSATARCLATGRSRSIGLIIPDIANPFYPALARGVEATLGAAGYGVFLCDTDGDIEREADHVRTLIDKRVDGIIIDSAGSERDDHIRRLDDAGIPVVLLDRVVGERSSHRGVFVDNQAGARDAARHLFSAPGRELVYVNGPAALSQSIERRAGVVAAMTELGVPDARLRVVEGDFSLESGYRLIAALIAEDGGRPRFNAIFAANDVMALGALRALRQAGVAVPGEVEVIGFDDIDIARMIDPPLSTVSQPTREMGAAGADLLLRLIAGERPRRKTVVMTPRLELRGTTAPLTISQGERFDG